MTDPRTLDRQARAPQQRAASRTPCGVCGLPGLVLLRTPQGPRIACKYCTPLPAPRTAP